MMTDKRPGEKTGAFLYLPTRALVDSFLGRRNRFDRMAALKPGDQAPASGIYKVVHDGKHAKEHEVTAVIGEPFPQCKICGRHPKFILIRAAHHVCRHEYFKPPP